MLKQPKILPSSDLQWKEYYQRACKVADSRNRRLTLAIEEAVKLLGQQTGGHWADPTAEALWTLKEALRHPILRRADTEEGGVVYTDDDPIKEETTFARPSLGWGVACGSRPWRSLASGAR